MKTIPSTDFTIVGGGLVGSLLALLLAKRNYSVTLIERKKAPAPKVEAPLDTRALALNYGTVELFKKWGLGDLFDRASFISKIHVSDKGHRGIVHVDAAAEKLEYLGAVVPFEELVFALQEKALAEAKIHFMEGEIAGFEEEADLVNITLKANNQTFTSKILIGADGVDSFVRKTLGISIEEYDYEAEALIGKVRVQKQVADCAFERFTEEGPIALLPAGDCLYTLVWVHPKGAAPDPLLPTLQKAFGYRAGIFVDHGTMKTYPLKRADAQEIHRGRVGLLGNAAHLLHPVSGQGFNLSVRDILCFVEVLDMQKTLDASLWEGYAKRSAFQQNMLKKLTHSFVKCFETNNRALSLGRNTLLQLFEWSAFGRSELNDVMIGRY